MAKQTIITDVDTLHNKSESVDPTSVETMVLIRDLYDSLPAKQLGLAAPQINTFQRVFVAWLPALKRKFAFINPKFVEKSENVMPSTEGCLSLPKVMRTIERCAQVVIDADRILELHDDGSGFTVQDVKGPLLLNWLEAFVVQHEYDHLEGVLITDLPAVPSLEEKMQERKQQRQSKIQAKRQLKQLIKTASTPDIGAKKPKSRKAAEKEKRRARKARKRQEKRIEIEERYSAKQEGLFDPSS